MNSAEKSLHASIKRFLKKNNTQKVFLKLSTSTLNLNTFLDFSSVCEAFEKHLDIIVNDIILRDFILQFTSCTKQSVLVHLLKTKNNKEIFEKYCQNIHEQCSYHNDIIGTIVRYDLIDAFQYLVEEKKYDYLSYIDNHEHIEIVLTLIRALSHKILMYISKKTNIVKYFFTPIVNNFRSYVPIDIIYTQLGYYYNNYTNENNYNNMLITIIKIAKEEIFKYNIDENGYHFYHLKQEQRMEIFKESSDEFINKYLSLIPIEVSDEELEYVYMERKIDILKFYNRYNIDKLKSIKNKVDDYIKVIDTVINNKNTSPDIHNLIYKNLFELRRY